MGYIYVVDTGEFRKIGKTSNVESRFKHLLYEYGISEFENSWFSESTDSYDQSECIAHSIVRKSRIIGERFASPFQDCVKACLSAVVRSNGLISAGKVGGIQVMVDPSSGYIDATKFIRAFGCNISISQFLKTDSVASLNKQIIEQTGMPTYFSTVGINGTTFMHPYVFVEVNRSISAKRKLEVYEWMLNIMPKIDPIRNRIEKTRLKKAAQ